MEKKITKKDRFNQLLEIAEVAINEDLVAFIKHEIELLEKKNSRSGQTKTQKENEILVEQLFSALSEFDKPITISEFMKESTHEVSTLSNQKLSALMKKLVDAERVVKTTAEAQTRNYLLMPNDNPTNYKYMLKVEKELKKWKTKLTF